MAWQIAIVFDKGEPIETLHANLYIQLGQMPVWAVAECDRVPGAAELRKQWEKCWLPEPALTIVKPGNDLDGAAKALDLVPTIQDHHFRMTAVRLFGIERSEPLVNGMAGLGFAPIVGTVWDGLGFAKPLDQIDETMNVELDAAQWQSEVDFYDAFFNAVGAPEWHGRNFNALHDSIGGGGINKVEVPYRLVLRNTPEASAEITDFIRDLADLIKNLQINGCPVELRIE